MDVHLLEKRVATIRRSSSFANKVDIRVYLDILPLTLKLGQDSQTVIENQIYII